MGRRLQVETNDCGRLLLELRVIADHVVATPVRLQPRLSPHPGHTHMVNAERGPQLAAAPMGGAIGGLAMQSPIDDPELRASRLPRWAHVHGADSRVRASAVL